MDSRRDKERGRVFIHTAKFQIDGDARTTTVLAKM
jgi:hypothetical protein